MYLTLVEILLQRKGFKKIDKAEQKWKVAFTKNNFIMLFA